MFASISEEDWTSRKFSVMPVPPKASTLADWKLVLAPVMATSTVVPRAPSPGRTVLIVGSEAATAMLVPTLVYRAVSVALPVLIPGMATITPPVAAAMDENVWTEVCVPSVGSVGSRSSA